MTESYQQKLTNLNYQKSDQPRMFLYVWYEKTNPEESKKGEHWVLPNVDPVDDILTYIRSSMSRRKDLFDDGTVVVEMIWDVTNLAKEIDKFYPNSKVDDYIRQYVGDVKQSEVHSIPAHVVVDRVEQFLTDRNQPKPEVKLSTAQYQIVSELKDAYNKGYRRVCLEACPRLGKTISSSASKLEIGFDLTVVASYVKTVQQSFKTDLQTFEQTKGIVFVDTQDVNYQEKILTALSENKKVVAYLSLVKGDYRRKRIDFLFNLNVKRSLVIDEADFGAWKIGQVKVLKESIKEDDFLLLMTGTEPDKAAKLWEIDYMMSTTYFELLVDKENSKEILNSGQSYDTNPDNLSLFEKDLNRDLLYPDVEGYYLDLNTSVEKSIKDGNLPESEFKKLPSWNKFVENPIKAKGWYSTMVQGLFQGKHNLNEINVDLVSNNTSLKRRVSMMFFPYGVRVDKLSEITRLTQHILPEWEVIELSGNKTTQAKAEKLVKQKMKDNPNKSILIISAIMGQRSFSIKQLDEVYLCYDNGGFGSTQQKLSRALTSDSDNILKVGKIFSLSFDSNRDDKFDSLIMSSALNLMKKKKSNDVNECVRTVLTSIDIFSTTNEGERIKLEIDSFIESSLKRKSISRVMGQKTDLTKLSDDDIIALANSDVDYFRSEVREAAKKGETFSEKKRQNKKKKGKSKKPTDNMLENAKKAVTAIYEHSDILIYSSKPHGATTIREAFDIFEENSWDSIITDEFGVDYSVIKFMFLSGVINESWVNILHK